MKILDPGHEYRLDVLDAPTPLKRLAGTRLRFVKRIGDKFPGNEPPAYCGTTTQEVIRALIDRTKYVDGQIHFDENIKVLHHLRMALTWLEHRAALARGDDDAARVVWNDINIIEIRPTCAECGHVLCTREEH